jgi:hypothetical protein
VETFSVKIVSGPVCPRWVPIVDNYFFFKLFLAPVFRKTNPAIIEKKYAPNENFPSGSNNANKPIKKYLTGMNKEMPSFI